MLENLVVDGEMICTAPAVKRKPEEDDG